MFVFEPETSGEATSQSTEDEDDNGMKTPEAQFYGFIFILCVV